MTDFTTTITRMYTLPQVDGETDVVVNVMFTVTGVDGTTTASIDGNQMYTYSGGNFTPYDQLTQEQVISWIDPQTITNLQACVQGQINSINNPPVSPSAQPLPWSITE